MNIRDLYKKYQIMPQLETHMLRVAGVGKIIAEHWREECDSQFATQLCLVHDLGNIVKFDLRDAIERSKFGKVENLPYWQGVQRTCWDKYGKDAHVATIKMLEEAGLTRYIDPINEEAKLYFSEAKEVELASANIESIILMYADCKVIPSGVVSYRERINDLRERYGGTNSDTWEAWTYWFEEWMQSKVGIDLNSISEEMVDPFFDELLTYEIQ